MNKTTKILLSFTTGALAGILTGLLLAPDKKIEKEKGKRKRKEKSDDEAPLFFEKTATADFDFEEQET